MKKLFIPVLLFFSTNLCNAQDSVFYKHELGIDVANILTFIKKNTQSYLVNYKYSFSWKLIGRAAINLELSNDNSSGIYPDFRLGIESRAYKEKWALLYGFDVGYSYFKAHAVPVSTTRWRACPLIGVQYSFSKHLSLTTEFTLDFDYYEVRDPKSFDPASNYEYYRIYIGSVGMIFLYYHF